MGQFIITRTPKGDSFCLKSDSGRTLAVSRHYATLDACKKGIATLIINAPLMPVVDATVGEYGKNPKFEMVSAEGGFAYLAKSPNGKTVIASPAYATKKACLRAISMLRSGVLNFEILFYNREGYTPIVMKALNGISPKPISVEPPKTDSSAKALLAEAPDDAVKAPVEAPAAPQRAPESGPERSPAVPRLIRLQPTPKAPDKAPEKSESGKSRYGIFDKIFKK